MAGAVPVQRDPWFDPWLVPVGASLISLADNLQDVLEGRERRKRARKPDDQRRFTASVRAVVANLAAMALEPSKGGALAIPLANLMMPGAARYGNPETPVKTLKAVVLACADAGLLVLTPGYRSRTTTIRATDVLIAEMQSRRVAMADVGRDGDDVEEVIILTRKRREELPGGMGASPRVFSERIGYLDTPDTHKMRDDVRAVNAWLAAVNVAMADEGDPHPHIDTDQRRLRRYFALLPGGDAVTPMFNLGGRLFGGFWQSLERHERRSSLRINGEPIAEVDFNALFLRLAYAQLGADLPGDPDADPYDIVGFPPGHRGALKMALNALFFADGVLKRLPPDIAKVMPRGWTARRVRGAILKVHPALSRVFGQRSGFGFMFTESEILMMSLKRMREADLTALPLHDAVLVPQSRGEEAKAIMQDVGMAVAGVFLPVSLKVGPGD